MKPQYFACIVVVALALIGGAAWYALAPSTSSVPAPLPITPAPVATSTMPGSASTSTSTPVTGGARGEISGIVLLGPTCPVMRNPPDPQCADRPYAAALSLVSARQGSVVQNLTATAKGTFSLQVPPGEYEIRPAVGAPMLPRCSTASSFVVRAGQRTDVKVYCDTGIR